MLLFALFLSGDDHHFHLAVAGDGHITVADSGGKLFTFEMLDVFGDATVSQIKRAIGILRRNNKYVGIACGFNEPTLKYWMELGFDMVFAGADWNFICECGKKTFEAIKGLQK